jgi:hypothetical protein
MVDTFSEPQRQRFEQIASLMAPPEQPPEATEPGLTEGGG